MSIAGPSYNSDAAGFLKDSDIFAKSRCPQGADLIAAPDPSRQGMINWRNRDWIGQINCVSGWYNIDISSRRVGFGFRNWGVLRSCARLKNAQYGKPFQTGSKA
jgi:hypothetical protein